MMKKNSLPIMSSYNSAYMFLCDTGENYKNGNILNSGNGPMEKQ